MLPLTFADVKDYDKIESSDKISIVGLEGNGFQPGKSLIARLHKKNGKVVDIKVNHSFNEGQIAWFKAGSALNLMASS